MNLKKSYIAWQRCKINVLPKLSGKTKPTGKGMAFCIQTQSANSSVKVQRVMLHLALELNGEDIIFLLL